MNYEGNYDHELFMNEVQNFDFTTSLRSQLLYE